MELNKPFSLPAVFGAVPSATEDENHRMLSLQLRELPALRSVVGQFVVGEDSPWNNVRAHLKTPFFPFLLELISFWFVKATDLAANCPFHDSG
jgi:hypothetical protein